MREIRPTHIYWLFDMRPETLIERPFGRPFYCGKTVKNTSIRLANHQAVARTSPNRPVSIWLNRCGDYVRAQTMEIVHDEWSWGERERYWICTLRAFHPGGANVTSGGQGTPGRKHSPETRAKIGATQLGHEVSAEARRKMSIAKKGTKLSPEHRSKISAAGIGRVFSAELRAKIGATQRGRKPSLETRARMSAGQRARYSSVDARSAIQ